MLRYRDVVWYGVGRIAQTMRRGWSILRSRTELADVTCHNAVMSHVIEWLTDQTPRIDDTIRYDTIEEFNSAPTTKSLHTFKIIVPEMTCVEWDIQLNSASRQCPEVHFRLTVTDILPAACLLVLPFAATAYDLRTHHKLQRRCFWARFSSPFTVCFLFGSPALLCSEWRVCLSAKVSCLALENSRPSADLEPRCRHILGDLWLASSAASYRRGLLYSRLVVSLHVHPGGFSEITRINQFASK